MRVDDFIADLPPRINAMCQFSTPAMVRQQLDLMQGIAADDTAPESLRGLATAAVPVLRRNLERMEGEANG